MTVRPTSNYIVRKPLTVIIVTLSVVCTLKGMLRWSIQRIKAMLLCIVYAMLFVDSDDIHRENYWGGSLRKLWVEMH